MAFSKDLTENNSVAGCGRDVRQSKYIHMECALAISFYTKKSLCTGTSIVACDVDVIIC